MNRLSLDRRAGLTTWLVMAVLSATIGLRAQRLGLAGRCQAGDEGPYAGGDHLLVERRDVADRGFALRGRVVVVGEMYGDQELRHVV